MTTAVPRKPPAHGTYARANGSPGYRPACNCDRCHPVLRATKKRLKVNRLLGQPAIIDAAPARLHLQQLHKTMGWEHLERVTGLTWHTLQAIHNGDRAETRATTAAAILAIEPTTKPDPGFYVDATGTVRRIRALTANAHSTQTIADAAGSGRSKIEQIMHGVPRVRQKLADKIADAYEALADTTGTSTRARNRAAREGWHDPQWWDDMGRIDDPDFDPNTPEAPRYMSLGEDGLWLEAQNYTRQQAADRLGVEREYLNQCIRRYRDALTKQEQQELEAAA